MIVLDTNVLVYALGSDHPLRDPARLLVQRVRDGQVEATTLDLVYAEFLHVYSRRRSREIAATAVRAYLELLGEPLALDAGTRSTAIDLFAAHPGLHGVDSYLAAASLRSGAEALATADRAFAAVPGLRVLDLETYGR